MNIDPWVVITFAAICGFTLGIIFGIIFERA